MIRRWIVMYSQPTIAALNTSQAPNPVITTTYPPFDFPSTYDTYNITTNKKTNTIIQLITPPIQIPFASCKLSILTLLLSILVLDTPYTPLPPHSF